jgi:hypothetical protein
MKVEERSAKVVEASVSWNYKTYLNIAFLALTALLVWRFVRTGGLPMLLAMNQPAEASAKERLARLRRHQESLTAQIDALRKCFDWIEYKASIYEKQLASRATTSHARSQGDAPQLTGVRQRTPTSSPMRSLLSRVG